MTALVLAMLAAAAPGTRLAVAAPPAAAMQHSHGRYLGRPDLQLTSAVIAAGGGPRAFDATRLLGVVTGGHRDAEVASLQRRFGARRVTQFAATFDTFVYRAVRIAAEERIALPPPPPALARNPHALAAALRNAGVMPDGRWDVGYLLEHLLSRPMHKRLMDEVNGDPSFGPQVNGDFHVILTAAMNDLKALYRLPR